MPARSLSSNFTYALARMEHRHAYRPWDYDEEKMLVERFKSGAKFKNLSNKHGRSEFALAIRLQVIDTRI